MKLTWIIAGALALVATGANAQSSKEASEYFHSAPGGKSEITVHGGYRMGTFRTTGAGAKDTKMTGLDRLGVFYDYGLNDSMSLGADLSYSSFTQDTTPETKNQGIEPVELRLQGALPISLGFFNYGLNGTFALEKAKVTTTETNRTLGDVATGEPRGGFHLEPFIGVSGAAGPGTVGAKLASELISTDTTADSNGTDVTYKGGNRTTLAAFYEYMLSDMPLGLALNYINQSEIKYSPAGGETTLTRALSLTGLELYARIPQSGNSAWIPSMTYNMKSSSDDYDKLDDLHLNIAYRMDL